MRNCTNGRWARQGSSPTLPKATSMQAQICEGSCLGGCREASVPGRAMVQIQALRFLSVPFLMEMQTQVSGTGDSLFMTPCISQQTERSRCYGTHSDGASASSLTS